MNLIIIIVCLILQILASYFVPLVLSHKKPIKKAFGLILISAACLLLSFWQLLTFFSFKEVWIYGLMAVVYAIVYVNLFLLLPISQSAKNSKKSTIKGAEIFASLFDWLILPIEVKSIKLDDSLKEEEIREMLHSASESQSIEKPQQEIIDNVFELDDTDVEEICTHRSQVVSLRQDDSVEDWRKIILENRHTFYPIVGEDDDDIIGILDTRDYFRLDNLSKENIMEKAVEKPLFVYETSKADDLFHLMKDQKTYFAIVLDEYGGVTGVATLHDVVETLLGEMQELDEQAEPEDIVKMEDGRYKIQGSASLEDVAKELDLPITSEDYDTFGGYVLGEYGHIPDDGIMNLWVDCELIKVLIREVKNHRVGLTIVEKKNSSNQENEK